LTGCEIELTRPIHDMPSLPPPPDRRNAIGALRLLLAGLVIYTHAHYIGGFGPEWLSRWSGGTLEAGTVAVQCFFVLSGWLVATSWRRQPSLGPYLWHRFLRLAPGLWVCLAVTAFILTPLLWLTTPDASGSFSSFIPSAIGYVWHNLVLPRSQIAIGPFPNGGPWAGDWNGSLWTLFYEGACYLMVAALGLTGLLSRRRVFGTVLIGALLALHMVWATMHPAWLPGVVERLYNTPGKLLTLHFLAGAAWAVWPDFTTDALRRPWFALAAAVVLVASWHAGFHGWISPLLMPPALLWLARHGPFVDFERQAGGDYSYGLYIYGYPAQQVLAHFGVYRLGFAPYLIAGLALSLGLAFLSWHLVEKPALSLRKLPGPRLSPPVRQPA
jgi:peptidoglycan/LPS O-acetylase OafA/YrhL